MEFKTNQQVIRMAQAIKTETAEHNVETEILLPDSYGDIGRILKCKGIPTVLSAQVRGQTATVEGTLAIQLLYVNNDGEMVFFTQSIPFYHELNAPEGNVTVTACGVMDFCNCRGVNSRKVEIRGAITLKAEFRKICDLTLITDGVGCGVQLQTTREELSTRVCRLEKNLALTDEIQIDADSIYTMMRWDGVIRDIQCSLLPNKTTVKGTLEIHALYWDTHGRYCPLQAKLPFHQILETEGVDADCLCHCTGEVTALELRPRTGLDGECKTLLVNANIKLCATAVKTFTLPLVTDGFSTKCALSMRKHTAPPVRFLELKQENHLCKKQLDLGREIGSVVDIWCETVPPRVQCTQNALQISDVLTVCVVILDTDGVPVYLEKTVDTHWEHTVEFNGTIECTPTLKATDLSYSLSSDTALDLRVTLEIDAPIYGRLPLYPVVELTVDTSVEAPACPAPLVVYFAREGEPVFQIARKYSTTVKAIMEANELTDPCAPGGPLLVPACKE